ncbi:hypothetical protein SK128_013436 [Halocaridina rubra]|uniref:Uncharacterized protein n=1 Tax=Halocaridina rubra TaxID=373956 RepID=A0AAN8X6T4_HALRR
MVSSWKALETYSETRTRTHERTRPDLAKETLFPISSRASFRPMGHFIVTFRISVSGSSDTAVVKSLFRLVLTFRNEGFGGDDSILASDVPYFTILSNVALDLF